MSQYQKTVQTFKVDVTNLKNPFVTLLSGELPSVNNGAGCRFRFGFYLGDEFITDISDITSMRMYIKALQTTAIGLALVNVLATLDVSCTEADFNSGAKAQATVDLEGDEMTFDLNGAKQLTLYLLLTGFTSDDPTDRDDFGFTNLTVIETGNDGSAGPVQAGNLVAAGAVYDGAGHYTVNVSVTGTYQWLKGANDTSVTNGTQTVNTDGAAFIAQGATVVLNGTIGAAVTAVVRNAGTLTPDQMKATFVQQITPGANYRFKAGQMQFWDATAFAADNTKPWRAMGVNGGATIWSDPIAD